MAVKPAQPTRVSLINGTFIHLKTITDFLDKLIVKLTPKNPRNHGAIIDDNSKYLQSVFQAKNDQGYANNQASSNVTTLGKKPVYDGNVLETAVFLETSLHLGKLDNEKRIDFSKVLGKELETLKSKVFPDETHIDSDKDYKKHLTSVYAHKLLLEACNSKEEDIKKSRNLFKNPFSTNPKKDLAFRKAVFAEMQSILKTHSISSSKQLDLAVELHKRSKKRLLETDN